MKAIALIRVSTLHQDLNQQTEAVISEVVKDGYKREDIITIEEKESAVKLDEESRLGLNRMKSAIEEDASINSVYVFELSRLSRRPDVLYSVRDFLINRRIQLIVLKPYMRLLEDDGSVSNSASIMFAIFGALAEQEGYVRKERLARGKLQKKSQGLWAGGCLPFGYQVNPKTQAIEINPTEAVTIRKMFEMYANDGKSTGEIAKYFNQTGELKCCDGHTTVETARSQIGHMLKNPVYVGGKSWNHRSNKQVENIYPRIVSDELFEKAGQRLHRVKGNTKGVKKQSSHVYFCKGLLRDKEGHLLTGFSVSNAYRYSCTNFDGSRYSITVPINLTDSVVWHLVKEYRKKNVPLKEVELKKKVKTDLNQYLKKLGVAHKKIKSFDDQILKINERIISGRLKESVGDTMLDQIEEQKNRVAADIVEWTLHMQHLAETLDKLERGEYVNPETAQTDQEMSDIIHQCIVSIEVEPIISWGIYEFTITFENNDFEMFRINSMSKKAWYSMKPDDIDFDYMERFLRPDTKRNREKKEYKK